MSKVDVVLFYVSPILKLKVVVPFLSSRRLFDINPRIVTDPPSCPSLKDRNLHSELDTGLQCRLVAASSLDSCHGHRFVRSCLSTCLPACLSDF
jgi:hypothetical protein